MDNNQMETIEQRVAIGIVRGNGTAIRRTEKNICRLIAHIGNGATSEAVEKLIELLYDMQSIGQHNEDAVKLLTNTRS
jgi:hypothetical protein